MLIVKEGTNGWDGTDEATKKLVIEGLEKEGVTVRNADQDKQYLVANSQKAIDEAFRTRNQQMEDTIKEMTGVDKAHAGEKYYEYFKRAIEVKNTELGATKDKLKKLEEGGGGALADEYKKRIDTLEKQIQTSKVEFDKKLAEKDGAVFKTKFQASLSEAVNKIKASFRGDLAEEVIPDIIKARTMEFESLYTPKEVGGITILHDSKGDPILSKKDGKPESIEDKLTEIFAPYIDAKKPQGGAGSGKPAAGGAGTGAGAGNQAPAWKDSKLPDTIKTKPALTQWLQNDLKLKSGTADFDQAFKQFSTLPDGKELPMRATAVTQ